MSDRRIQQLLRDHAREELPDTPDLWPAIRAAMTRRSAPGPSNDPIGPASARLATAPAGVTRNGEAARPSLRREFAKMAAGVAVIVTLGLVLAAMFSGQRAGIPGAGDDGETILDSAVATDGIALVYRWDEDRQINELMAVDARTGEPSDQIPAIPLGAQPGSTFPVGMSADGSRFATISADEPIEAPLYGGIQTWPRANRLTIVDTESSELVETDLPDDGWVVPILPPLFSPDGEILALSYEREDGSTIMLFDAGTAELLGEYALGERISFLDFSSSGEELIAYGQEMSEEPNFTRPEPPGILVLHSRTLEITSSHTLPKVVSGHWCEAGCDQPLQDREIASWRPGIAHHREQQALYVAHIDQPVVERIDLRDGTHSTIQYDIISSAAAIEDESGWTSGGFGDLRVGPDAGQLFLLAGGPDALSQGFIVIDLEARTGEVQVTGDKTVPVSVIETVPDGSSVFLAGHRFVARLDSAGDGLVEAVSEWSAVPARTLDGRAILLASDQPALGDQSTPDGPRLGVIDPDTLEVVAEWETSPDTEWVYVPGWQRISSR